MKEITTTITQRCQVAISAKVRLAPVSFALESAYGSVKPSRKPEDFDEVSQIAKSSKAESSATTRISTVSQDSRESNPDTCSS